MEHSPTAKKPKPAGQVKTAPVRVSKETRKRIISELTRLNKKDLGRRIKVDELIALGLSLLTSEHHAQLQDATLSNADRLERRYLGYIKDHGPISKDRFLGKVLAGEVAGEAPANAATL